MPASPSHSRPRPQPEDARLRDLFSRGLGWQPAAGLRSELAVEGQRYLLTPLASRSPAVALLCEPLQARGLPNHAARRRIRARVRALFPRPLLVFTDAAHRVQVWSWELREPQGPLAGRELSRQTGEPPAEWLRTLRWIVHDLEGSPAPPTAGPGVEAPEPSVLAALLRAVSRSDPAVFRPGGGLAPLADAARGTATAQQARSLPQDVQDAIEGSDDPGLLRAVWSGLSRLHVLDPACGDGEWLLAVMRSLEPVYLACLDRMRGWVDEADRGRVPRTRFADFRSVLERAGDFCPHPGHRRFVRESVILRNLFGAERDPEALAATRLRLRMCLESEPGDSDAEHLPPALACNLRQGDPGAGFRSLQELQAALARAGSPGRFGTLLDEVDTLERAEQRLRSLRLVHGAPYAELLAGWEAIGRRRDALAEGLDRLLARCRGVDPRDRGATADRCAARRPLHRCVEYYGILRRGGFSLEREGPP